MRSSGHKQELLAANMGWQNDERIRCVLVLSTLALKYGRARTPGNTGRAKVIAAHRQLQTLIGANEADRRAMDKAMADYASTWQPRPGAAAAARAALGGSEPRLAVALAAGLWCLGFALFLCCCGPMLWRPRVDGRPG